MYTTMSHDGIRPTEVRYKSFPKNPGMEVQVFLGTSNAAVYMDVEEARNLAQQIFAALPADDRDEVAAR